MIYAPPLKDGALRNNNGLPLLSSSLSWVSHGLSFLSALKPRTLHWLRPYLFIPRSVTLHCYLTLWMLASCNFAFPLPFMMKDS